MIHRRFRGSIRSTAPILLLLTAAFLSGGCSVNPATGRNQLNFFGEESEIEMGREADAEIVGSVGLYDDPLLQDYVHDLGMEIAAQSERPNLPWSFKILDDSAVNAFALPGGFVYVTRGLLSHLGSEAELVSVLGHEAGHVTARHGVNQVSKQILATVGVGVAVLANPDLHDWAFLGEVGLGLVFLKYSRDDERQADDLGLRYSIRTGYDPNQMPEVFRVLDAVSQVEGAAEGAGRLPNWLSTHPNPEARAVRIAEEVAALDGDFSQARVERDSYLQRLDGMVFGDDPQEGYFKGRAFMHPGLRFRIEFPEGWETANQKDAVTANDPSETAMVQVSMSEQGTRRDAEEAFYGEAGVVRDESWDRKVHGLPASWSRFEFQDETNDLRGTVAFVEHGGSIFQVMALSGADDWDGQQETLEETISSFGRLDDPKALSVKPQRIKVVRLDRDMTIEEFAKRYPSDVPLETVALINHVAPGGTLAKGRYAKRVLTRL